MSDSSPAVAAPIASTAETLLALAARCEAEEPSWELSVAIELAIDPDARPSTNNLYAVRKGLGLYNPPAYTTSLDAAATLVPEGWVYTINTFAQGASAYVMDADGGIVRAHGPYVRTPALALCAAALRARAALES